MRVYTSTLTLIAIRTVPMKIKELIELLQKHDHEAEVHFWGHMGYYTTVSGCSCVDDLAHYEAWLAEFGGATTICDPPCPPECDGSCSRKQAVVLSVD
jgi:hypothetical protein